LIQDDLIISVCGDVCSECPRYIGTRTNDIPGLKSFAELWYRLGFREEIKSPDDLKCHGCNKEMVCSHGVNNCEYLKGKNNCGECEYFPCSKINAVFKKTEHLIILCKEKCTENEYKQLF